MSIKLISLNIEGSKHLKRVLPFLQEQQADVIYLQEVLSQDIHHIETTLNRKGYFFPLTYIDKMHDQEKYDLEGILVFTKKEIVDIRWFTYIQDTKIFNKNIPAINLVIKDGKDILNIMGTHFVWTPDGEDSPEQWAAWNTLLPKLQKIKNFVICGDFNVPRGKVIHKEFCKHLTDNLPPHITTTLDPQFHRVPELVLAVDNIYSSGDHKVSNVEVVAGISDHMAIVGTVSKN